MNWEEIILTILGTLIVPLIGLAIKLIKENKDLKKREMGLKELCNYGYGCIDMINQASIKVEPEVREAMRNASKRYHSWDLVPELKHTEKENKKGEK